jgi:hypothetical protein
MAEHISTRVNAHRLAAYVGRTVRVVGKTIKVCKFDLCFSVRIFVLTVLVRYRKC